MDYYSYRNKERRILKDADKGTSFLAIKAAQDLIAKANIDPLEIDMIIMATATADMPVAATGVYVATEIGATNAFAYDLQAACSSFYMACQLRQLTYNLADIKKYY
jgi:3-oxoacyl-[acyl-carrier-protein] synthase-3